MNIRIFALGWLAKDMFERQMEMVALTQQKMAVGSMQEIARYLRSITPRSSGYMASTARGWDFHRRGRWGFSFFVGWRSSQFPKVFYPLFVLYGTGIYGLYGKPIRPKRASRLAWQTPGGKWVSKLEVKGQRHRPILKQVEQFGVKLLRQNLKFAYLRSMRTG